VVAYFQGRTVELPGSIDLNFYTVLKFRGPENNIRNGFRWQIHFSVACWNLSEYSRSGGFQDQAGLANKKKHPRQRKKTPFNRNILCFGSIELEKSYDKINKNMLEHLDKNYETSTKHVGKPSNFVRFSLFFSMCADFSLSFV